MDKDIKELYKLIQVQFPGSFIKYDYLCTIDNIHAMYHENFLDSFGSVIPDPEDVYRYRR